MSSVYNGQVEDGLPKVVFAFLVCTLIMVFSVSGDLLSFVGVNYKMQGGSFLQKIHPATYAVLFSFVSFLIYQNGREKLELLILSRTSIYNLSVCAITLVYTVLVLGAALTPLLVSWITPVLILLLVSNSSFKQKQQLTVIAHCLLFTNSMFGLYEFSSGSAIIPVALVDYSSGEIFDTEEWEAWRARGLFGHPLTATIVVACVAVCSFARILFSNSCKWDYFAFSHSLLALPAFGGRASIAVAVFFICIMSMVKLFLFLQGEKAKYRNLLASHFILLCLPVLILLVFLSGYLDPLIARIEDDNGSASTRLQAIYIMLDSSWVELLFGDVHQDLFSKQLLYGTPLGIEIFWVGLLLKYGLILSGLLCGVLFFIVKNVVSDQGRLYLWGFSAYFMALSSGTGLTSKTISLSVMVFLPYCFNFKRR